MAKSKQTEEFEFEDVSQEKEMVDGENIPEYGSEDWEPYIMSKFLPDELYNEKHPTLNGLRRISKKYFSSVISSLPVEIVNNMPVSAMCRYQIHFDNGQIFGAAADATQENINGNYNVYPTAIAESRAEARTYRKALMITAASAEEIKGNEATFDSVLESTKTVSDYNAEDPISEQQKTIVETKCKQMKIDIDKFLTSENVNFATAKKSDGVKLGKKLTEYQQKGVPKGLK